MSTFFSGCSDVSINNSPMISIAGDQNQHNVYNIDNRGNSNNVTNSFPRNSYISVGGTYRGPRRVRPAGSQGTTNNRRDNSSWPPEDDSQGIYPGYQFDDIGTPDSESYMNGDYNHPLRPARSQSSNSTAHVRRFSNDIPSSIPGIVPTQGATHQGNPSLPTYQSSPNVSSRSIPNRNTAPQNNFPIYSSPSSAKSMPEGVINQDVVPQSNPLLYNQFTETRPTTRSTNSQSMGTTRSNGSLRYPDIYARSPAAGGSEANASFDSLPEEYSSTQSSSLSFTADTNNPRSNIMPRQSTSSNLGLNRVPSTNQRTMFYGSNIRPTRSQYSTTNLDWAAFGSTVQPNPNIPIDQSGMGGQSREVSFESVSTATQSSVSATSTEKSDSILPDHLAQNLKYLNALPEVTEMLLPSPANDEQSPYKDLTGQVVIEPNYFALGGGGDIYKGEWKDPSSNKRIPVIVKKLRITGTINEKTLDKYRKHLNRETLIWSQLTNRHVLPFIGICRDIGPSRALVAPYCEGGDVVKYLKKFPNANRPRIVEDVTSGLQYLHSTKNIVHGDLKCENILIRKNGEACICDFGISKIIDHRGFTTALSGTMDFMAPELLTPPDDADESFLPIPTKESDMYAYALVVLQILTGTAPARGFGLAKALKRDRYDPEASINEQLWELLSQCCLPNPRMRPEIDDMVRFWSDEAGY